MTSKLPKGIYAYGEKFRVRKYNLHIGFFTTFEEAKMASAEAEKKHEMDLKMEQYWEAKKWLQAQGVIL